MEEHAVSKGERCKGGRVTGQEMETEKSIVTETEEKRIQRRKDVNDKIDGGERAGVDRGKGKEDKNTEC